MEIVERGVIHVVGIEVQGAWEDLPRKMGHAWEAMRRRASEVPGRLDASFVDVGLNHEGGVFTQVVGVQVAGITDVPDGMTGVTVPEQRYIHTHHAGPVTEVYDSFKAMFDYAAREEILLDHGEFKMDFGYTDDPARGHDLYLKLAE